MKTVTPTTSDTEFAAAVAALQRPRVRTVSTSGPLFESDRTVVVDTSAGSVTLTPPAASKMAGVGIRVIKPAAANTVTFDPAAPTTVNGAASHAFTTQWQQVVYTSDGSQWYAG
jgi:hypothetical protein